MTNTTDLDLSPYTEQEFQVWALTPQGGQYAYRTGLIYSVAARWTEQWNLLAPGDVPPGTTFARVVATTTYEVVR